MEYKIGDHVYCVGSTGQFEIVADKNSPETDVAKAPFFKKRSLIKGFDFLIARFDEVNTTQPLFVYATQGQLRKSK